MNNLGIIVISQFYFKEMTCVLSNASFCFLISQQDFVLPYSSFFSFLSFIQHVLIKYLSYSRHQDTTVSNISPRERESRTKNWHESKNHKISLAKQLRQEHHIWQSIVSRELNLIQEVKRGISKQTRDLKGEQKPKGWDSSLGVKSKQRAIQVGDCCFLMQTLSAGEPVVPLNSQQSPRRGGHTRVRMVTE